MDKLIFIKRGIFYYCFSEDAYIMAYLFDYKITSVYDKDCVSFPTSNFYKIRSKLENISIGYVLNNEIYYGDSLKYYDLYNKGYDYICKLNCINKLKDNINKLDIEFLVSVVSNF